MINRDIPQEQWDEFLKDFSKRHAGERCRIELLGRDIGDQPAADNLPLVGISVDTKGSRTGSIEITTGDDVGLLSTHVIDHPTHVRVARDERGVGESVEIEADGEPTALIRLLETNVRPS